MYVRPTIKLNAATNQIVVFVRVDEILTMIWLSRSSEVRVKVKWDLKFQKWRFSNSVSSAIFQPIKKIQRFLILDQNTENLSCQIFEFSPSYRVTWLQTLPKNRQNFFRLILMKLGVMLEVDETFSRTWLSRSSEVKVRRWPQSPVGTIFFTWLIEYGDQTHDAYSSASLTYVANARTMENTASIPIKLCTVIKTTK